MGKSQSRMEEARKELTELENKGDVRRLREKLCEYIAACRLQGELGEAVTYLTKLLELQESDKDVDPLEKANTMYILGNTMRLQLQPMVDSSKPNPFPDEKERTKAFARAEDMLLRALEIRTEALKANPDSRDLKLAIARTKSALAMIQNSYGGDPEAAQAQHEGALTLFAEFPLASDPEGWSLVKGVWSSTKLGVVAPSSPQPPAPSFVKPGLSAEGSRSFRVESRISEHMGLRSQRATTTNNIPGEDNDVYGSLTEDEANPTKTSGSTKWRLIIKIPRVQERRPSALERLKRIGSFNNTGTATYDAFEGVVQKVDLEPGQRIEIGLPISEGKKAHLKPQGVTYVALGPKEKLGKVISERHCVLEEDLGSDDNNRRWIVSDPHASGKYKGILVNGVRISRAPLRQGDVVQLGNCYKVKMGSSALPEKRKSPPKDPLQNGIEYLVERVITTIDDTDVSSVAHSSLFETSDTADAALKHFHLLVVAAQINLNGPPVSIEQTSDLFASAVKSGVPFHLWDSWIYSELSKARLVA